MNVKFDEGLIVREYRQAKDKNKQVEILADLHGCKKEEIIQILTKHGAISGIPGAKPANTKTVWTREMDAEVSRLSKEGLNLKEIAERMGITVQSIYSRRKYLSSVPGEKSSKKVSDKLQGKNQPIKKEDKCSETVFDHILRLLSESGWDVRTCNIDVLNKSLNIVADKKEKSSCAANTRGQAI